MKKLVFLAILIFDLLSISAQHLRFENIPIDGNITNFQAKLANKGFHKNSLKSGYAPNGQRVFNGRFQGHDSEITVFYNRKTSIVYKVVVKVYSKKQSVIQRLLDTSVQRIIDKYHFKGHHDLEDNTRLHYQFEIFPMENAEEPLGTIHIEPTTAFMLDEKESTGISHAGFLIIFKYEDAINTSNLTPSTTEPKASAALSCGEPLNFNKFWTWANDYRIDGRYDKAIDYLTWLLDYYKYGCAPAGFTDQEVAIENEILYMQKSIIGQLKYRETGNHSIDVYRICDETTKFLKYIIYSGDGDSSLHLYYIKLTPHDISQHINLLMQLKTIFSNKIKSNLGNYLSIFWEEPINLEFPCLFYEEFSNSKWEKKTLKVKFRQNNQKIYIVMYIDGKTDVTCFSSSKDIDNYIKILENS